MDGPTIEDVRKVKAAMVQQFRSNAAFVGAGIGERSGRFTVRVNWRTLPGGIQLPELVGDVEVSHHEVGDIKLQAG
jgi:hypothetical protein